MSGVTCYIKGRDIYETIVFPEVPRVGDYLWLTSLTGRKEYPADVRVSRVEWSKEQMSGTIHVWLTVRRVPAQAEAQS